MANLGAPGVYAWLIENLAKNGKNARFLLEEGPPAKIIGSIPVESLTLPAGYYANPQGNISNKKNVPKGQPHDNILYVCNVQYLVGKEKEAAAEARRAKNPFLRDVFPKKDKKKK